MESVQQGKQRLLASYRAGLREIGYLDAHIKGDYAFTDVYSTSEPVRRIQMAAFAQEPPSIRNACLGIAVLEDGRSSGSPEAVEGYRALGAPQVFAYRPQLGVVEWWRMRAQGPSFVEQFQAEHLPSAMRQNKAQWNPQEVLRAKSIGYDLGFEQRDFFDSGLIPALEEVVHRKLNTLLSNVLDSSKAVYTEYHNAEPDYKELFRLVFRLLAAKLLIDRQHPGTQSWAASDARTVIEAVEAFYFSGGESGAVLPDARVQGVAWKMVREAFHFPNLPLEALAYVYENTLVSRETRKQHDTHATPPAFAEYVVRHLPFHHIDQESRRVFEPFCGHAPFLIAALGKLRDLLPAGMDGGERHRYLTRMLSGIEVDSFAREVALYSLMLADYPHANGWNIAQGDAFSSSTFNELLQQSQVVLCNPPFGQFTTEQRQDYKTVASVNKGAEALRRVLARGPQMLGFVLPRAFLDRRTFAPMRRELAQRYNDITLISLPDIAFEHSQVETALILAHGKRAGTPICRCALVTKPDYAEFVRSGKPTWVTSEPTRVLHSSKDATLWRTPLQDVWDALSHLPLLSDVATVHRGIEYQDTGDVAQFVSDTPRPGFEPGLRSYKDGVEPLAIQGHQFLNMNTDVMRGSAYLFPWRAPKVITNAVRISRGPWSLVAAVDDKGLTCYQNLHGVWPKGNTQLELIAAVLNGPLANAFVSQRSSKHNQVRLLERVPFPHFSAEQEQLIVEMVRSYIAARQEADRQPSAQALDFCLERLREIDEVVLSCYGLESRLVEQVRAHFNGEPRPARLLQIEPEPAHELPGIVPVAAPAQEQEISQAVEAEMAAQREKNKPLTALLESWLREDVDEDEPEHVQSWEQTMKSLNENRLSWRPLFP